RDGTLWIGTQKGLASWKDGKLNTYAELSGQDTVALFQEREGTVWVGTIDVTSGARLCAIRDGTTVCSGGDGSLGPGVLSLFEDSKGNLWVGVQNGMWRWKPGPSEFFPVPQTTDGVRFGEDERGLLLGTKAGIKRLINNRVEPYSLGGVAQPIVVTRMLRDQNGGLWVGTLTQGVVHVHDGQTDTFAQTDGLSGDVVIKILEDREGNMWVATSNGLDRFREYAVPNISIGQGLSSAVTYSVLPANDGSIWIATANGLDRWKDARISVINSQAGNVQSAGRPSGSAFTSLFKDSSGKVWALGSHGFGYLEDKRLIPISDFPKGSGAFGIAEVGLGNLWLAHQYAGLLHISDGKVVQQIPWAGLGRKDCAIALAADPSEKGLWLGFAKGGVAYFAEGGIRKGYSANDGLGAGPVSNLRFGPRGALWAATQGGLSRIKDGKVATLTSKNGVPCDTVHWSMEDDDHSMWLYMTCGLVRIERSELDPWVADTTRQVKTTVFGISEGVSTHVAISAYQGAVAKSPDGKLWFTTQDGVRVVDPHHLAFNKLPPPVHIEQVTADDKPFEATNGMLLPPRIHYLSIDYTALSLVAPEKVRFRYKLDGVDADWREVVNDRQVQYSNLGPGTYRFHVKACNNSGVWNEEGATLDFVIPPMWYQTNWFRAACVAAFLAMVWGIYELRVRQLAAQFNMRLEERVAERTRVARDLHDTLLQSFQALLPSLQAGINMLAARPADARKVLEDTADHASQAIAEGRDAVQGLRMSTVEKNDLAVAIRTVGEELASDASTQPSPNFNVVVEGASRNLHPILRDEVYRLAVEALRNAFRHAAAQNVEVEIRYDEKYFRLRVRDDGKGIPSAVLSGDGREGHYGLPGMRERAKLVGGKLAIWTELDGGTEIELNIPGARAYVKSTRTFWHFGKGSATDTDEKEPIERE